MRYNLPGMDLAERLLNLPFVQGVTGGTEYNIKAALVVEEFVSGVWFPELARMARQEERHDLAKLFEDIAKGESKHAEALREAIGKLGAS